ncbi:MAG: universal stress protein [Hyphomonadaceae bacterium]
MAFDRILVPVDYSVHSLKAVGYAAELAQRLGANMDIVHVWDRPTYISDAVMVGHGTEQRSLAEMIRDNAKRDMDEFMSTVKLATGVNTSQRLLSGDPASAILKELGEQKYDLVVIGTHGRGGLAHLLLGSVAEKLVRLSTVPVLTVPRSAE